MTSTPPDLGELHRIHQQLSYIRHRHEPGDTHDADLASLQAELKNAEQALSSSNVGNLHRHNGCDILW